MLSHLVELFLFFFLVGNLEDMEKIFKLGKKECGLLFVFILWMKIIFRNENEF